MATLQPGQHVGAYVVDGLIGRGGMAELYRATHRVLQREAAIKVLDPNLGVDPTFPVRFLREAKAVAALSHPNIVTIYDFGEEGTLAYFAMQLATGGTLREREREFRTLAEAVAALTAVGDALAYAHARGICHRDVKPVNVLVDQQRLLLADFGIARIASENLDSTLTMTGSVFGTPHYMAPEQANGEDVDQRCDIYALGIVAYEMITGQLPFQGTTSFSILQQHLTAPPPSIRALLPAVPAALDDAIRRATAKRPADRFATVEAFVAALQQAAAEVPDLSIRTAAPIAPSPSQSAGFIPIPVRDPHNRGAALTDRTGADDAGGGRFVTAPWAGAGPGSEPVEVPGMAASEDPTTTRSGMTAGASRKWRRPTSFSALQWLTLGTGAIVVVFINAIGLWLTRAGASANHGNLAAGITSYIYNHLGAFKSSLTALAVVFAALAVFSMRAAVVEDHQLAPQTYRLLRQYHRFVGYGAIVIGLGVGLLTCIGIFGIGTAKPRAALHSVLGIALLAVIVIKLAVVRYYPAKHRHLKQLGDRLLVLFILVFATSTVPFLWSHLTSTSRSDPYHPRIGRDRIAPTIAGNNALGGNIRSGPGVEMASSR